MKDLLNELEAIMGETSELFNSILNGEESNCMETDVKDETDEATSGEVKNSECEKKCSNVNMDLEYSRKKYYNDSKPYEYNSKFRWAFGWR